MTDGYTDGLQTKRGTVSFQHLPEETRIEVFCRACSGAESQVRSVIERVQSLTEEGLIAAHSVETWPGRVSLRRNEHNREIVDQFDAFRRWAVANDATIVPPFSIVEHRCEITGDRQLVLKTPAVCLAVYQADRLLEVVPRTAGSTTVTIDSFLEVLEDRGDLSLERSARTDVELNPSI